MGRGQSKSRPPQSRPVDDPTEARLKQLAKTLEERLANVQRIESIVSLSAGTAHEFNNLLAVIMGNCDIIVDSGTDERERERAAKNIESAAQEGRKLTRQLLSFTRQEEFHQEPVDVNDVLANLEAFIDRVTGRNVSTQVKFDEELWPILSDRNYLEKALLNLILNARDALSDEGCIRLAACNKRNVNRIETLSGESIEGDFVVLSVADNGEGIPEEVLPRIFEPFFTTKNKERGSGLGLSMVHSFVKQCGAFICVDSTQHGTRFDIYFPRDGVTTQSSENESETNHSLPYQGMVLVVEDNEEVSWVVRRHMASLGFEVVVANSANEAEALFQKHKHDLSFVCCDYNLGEHRTGLDLIHGFRSQCSHVRFILSSGEALEEELTGLADATDIRLLQKPYRRQDLARLLQEMS